MPHVYTDEQPVEQPAIRLFASLGLTTVSALQNLHRARDLLLPRLFSWEVKHDVKDA